MSIVLATIVLDFVVFAGLLGVTWAALMQWNHEERISPAWIAVLIAVCALWDIHVIPAIRFADAEIVIPIPLFVPFSAWQAREFASTNSCVPARSMLSGG